MITNLFGDDCVKEYRCCRHKLIQQRQSQLSLLYITNTRVTLNTSVFISQMKFSNYFSYTELLRFDVNFNEICAQASKKQMGRSHYLKKLLSLLSIGCVDMSRYLKRLSDGCIMP